MAAAGRTEDPDVGKSLAFVRAELEDDPCHFQFFQAARLLELLQGGRATVGEFVPPAEEAVHFGVHNALAFPPSQIHDIEWPENGPTQMSVNFMGLTGILGALPYSYTELILERLRAKDRTMAA